MPENHLLVFRLLDKAEDRRRSPKRRSSLTVVDGNDDTGVAGQLLGNVDVHLRSRRVAPKVSHLLQRAGIDTLCKIASILAHWTGSRESQEEKQSGQEREERAPHLGNWQLRCCSCQKEGRLRKVCGIEKKKI